MAYAPPEVVAAYRCEGTVTVAASHDIWALGVMAFEALTGGRALGSLEQLLACARGDEAYPWDASKLADAPERWRRSRLRPLIEPCLAHDPSQRPAATDRRFRVCALT